MRCHRIFQAEEGGSAWDERGYVRTLLRTLTCAAVAFLKVTFIYPIIRAVGKERRFRIIVDYQLIFNAFTDFVACSAVANH